MFNVYLRQVQVRFNWKDILLVVDVSMAVSIKVDTVKNKFAKQFARQ